jgi:hypothetical protein
MQSFHIHGRTDGQDTWSEKLARGSSCGKNMTAIKTTWNKARLWDKRAPMKYLV